jgi:hypothetical protein
LRALSQHVSGFPAARAKLSGRYSLTIGPQQMGSLVVVTRPVGRLIERYLELNDMKAAFSTDVAENIVQQVIASATSDTVELVFEAPLCNLDIPTDMEVDGSLRILRFSKDDATDLAARIKKRCRPATSPVTSNPHAPVSYCEATKLCQVYGALPPRTA